MERPTQWLTAEEAARYAGFPSRKALYQAVRRGQIPAHRIGRRLRFSAGEIDRWIGRSQTLVA
jgi:excisionase family DNA binding protein